MGGRGVGVKQDGALSGSGLSLTLRMEGAIGGRKPIDLIFTFVSLIF